MTYNFDQVIERKNTNSTKYDLIPALKKAEDTLPLWVADMDFAAPKEVNEALIREAQHGIYGYSIPGERYYQVLSGWFEKQFGYPVKKEWVVLTPGIVFAIAMAIRAYTKEGDRVLIQEPVYHPFRRVIGANGRVCISNDLVLVDGIYHIDFDKMEQQIIDNKVKLFVLCSPHNPVGRVWTKEELIRVGEICLKHGVIVVSDEIHCDFVYEGNTHTVFSSISKEIAGNSIVCTAPSKTFNLAGLQASNIIIEDSELRKEFKQQVAATGFDELNRMALVACQSAYEFGEEWLNELKEYLYGNITLVHEFLKEKLPELTLISPEGTYLLWIDFRRLNKSKEELTTLIEQKARLWLNAGHMFGECGTGFYRVNVACPRSVLVEALERLYIALQ